MERTEATPLQGGENEVRRACVGRSESPSQDAGSTAQRDGVKGREAGERSERTLDAGPAVLPSAAGDGDGFTVLGHTGPGNRPPAGPATGRIDSACLNETAFDFLGWHARRSGPHSRGHYLETKRLQDLPPFPGRAIGDTTAKSGSVAMCFGVVQFVSVSCRTSLSCCGARCDDRTRRSGTTWCSARQARNSCFWQQTREPRQ